MNRWIAGGAAVLGTLVLTMFLFQRPDTGEALGDPVPPEVPSDAPRGPTTDDEAPAARPSASPIPTSTTDRGDRASRRAPADAAHPLPAGLEEARAWRNRPAAVYSSRVLAPFSAIRYVLMKDGTAEARTLADSIAAGPMEQLRTVRSSEDEDPLTAMLPMLREEAAKISASSYASDAGIANSLTKLNAQIAEFEKVIAEGGEALPEALPPSTNEGTPESP